MLGAPSPEDLLRALGRELWVIGDELLTVSARIKAGASLGAGGIALRNAADLMLEGDWESVMGELETAAVSAPDFLPYERYEGLVNLFSYYEPVPQCEWLSARDSLLGLSQALSAGQMDILRNLEGAYRQETDASLRFVIQRLRKAGGLFEPGGFYMPAEPRSEVDRQGRGSPRNPEAAPWARGPPPDEAAYRAQALREALRREAQVAVMAVGGKAPVMLAQVERELLAANAAASPEDARRAALRRLVRELHPDRNPGNEDEVRPVFQYVQNLRNEEK